MTSTPCTTTDVTISFLIHQGNGYNQMSCYEDVLSVQVESIVAQFAVPETERARFVTAWINHQYRQGNAKVERDPIRCKLDRLRDTFLERDMDKTEYQERKANLTNALAALPSEDEIGEGAAERLAASLADVASAWKVAMLEEWNRLAREIFDETIIKSRTAVAVKPRPNVLPFFQAVKWCEGRSDGDRTRTYVMFWMTPWSSPRPRRAA